ncbi:hypothetical protein [Natronorubrum sulfidifaciens]|uniref:hypothetical protein n=1 Tax=Natronorubrum sulfidifaciens TaxID=388259 RepID=UPI001F4CBA88|nr:hypothetical protein [Natronorubrum sulfidifaciens]
MSDRIGPNFPSSITEKPRLVAIFVRHTGIPDTINLKQHENCDDMTVWLSQEEVERLLEAADGIE